MVNPLSNDQLEHLLSFIGYGRLDAPVWFLGMEEAGGDEYSLHARSNFAVVEDCKCAHDKIGQRAHHWERRDLQSTWNRMCGIMLEFEGLPNDKEGRRDYQSERLGRENGDTLLLELLPIPSDSIDTWNHSELLPQFRDRRDYTEKVIPRRVGYIRELVREYRPQVVICHGKGKNGRNVDCYKAIFDDMAFASVRAHSAFADMKIAQHWLFASNDERCVLILQNLSRLNSFGVAFPAIAKILRTTSCGPWLEKRRD